MPVGFHWAPKLFRRERLFTQVWCLTVGMVRVAIVLLGIVPCLAADWGPIDHDLRLSADLNGQEIRVSLQNAGSKDLLIPLGMKVAKPHPTGLKVMLETPDGARPKVIY